MGIINSVFKRFVSEPNLFSAQTSVANVRDSTIGYGNNRSSPIGKNIYSLVGPATCITRIGPKALYVFVLTPANGKRVNRFGINLYNKREFQTHLRLNNNLIKTGLV